MKFDCLPYVQDAMDQGVKWTYGIFIDPPVDSLPVVCVYRCSDEWEARLVFSPNPDCQIKPRFRVDRGMLVPYYCLQELAHEVLKSTWKLPLTSVQIGPGPNRELNARAVESLLEQHNYPKMVTVSTTPYRA